MATAGGVVNYTFGCHSCKWECSSLNPPNGQLALIGHPCKDILTDPLAEGWVEDLRRRGIPTSDRELGWTERTDNTY